MDELGLKDKVGSSLAEVLLVGVSARTAYGQRVGIEREGEGMGKSNVSLSKGETTMHPQSEWVIFRTIHRKVLLLERRKSSRE